MRLIFGTCLHIRDKELLIGIANYLNNYTIPTIESKNISTVAGEKVSSDIEAPQGDKYIYDSINKGYTLLQVKNYEDILNKIIPFFNKYLIKGVKYLDYLDWCKGVELINNKNHLTKEGLEQLREIKSRMNRGRD